MSTQYPHTGPITAYLNKPGAPISRSFLRNVHPGGDAFSAHKELMSAYSKFYGGDRTVDEYKKMRQTVQRNEVDILREQHRFLRTADDDSQLNSSWEARLAKRYYDRLFREFALCDLRYYKQGKIALRWRTGEEVENGKGQFDCGNLTCRHKGGKEERNRDRTRKRDKDGDGRVDRHCEQDRDGDGNRARKWGDDRNRSDISQSSQHPRLTNPVIARFSASSTSSSQLSVHPPPAPPSSRLPLRTWEVPFGYVESGSKKYALVKLRLCRWCSRRLNWKKEKERKQREREAERRERGVVEGGEGGIQGELREDEEESGSGSGMDGEEGEKHGDGDEEYGGRDRKRRRKDGDEDGQEEAAESSDNPGSSSRGSKNQPAPSSHYSRAEASRVWSQPSTAAKADGGEEKSREEEFEDFLKEMFK
ncbi:hypothetical protein HDU93_005191 [Gonapodya sp. JEL0774]|nr:hypothetical protein HDU93_005191 [Gonapodya sp. JEL0774]